MKQTLEPSYSSFELIWTQSETSGANQTMKLCFAWKGRSCSAWCEWRSHHWMSFAPITAIILSECHFLIWGASWETQCWWNTSPCLFLLCGWIVQIASFRYYKAFIKPWNSNFGEYRAWAKTLLWATFNETRGLQYLLFHNQVLYPLACM